MKKILLHGRLGDVVGAEWNLDVRSIAEGVRAIEMITGKIFEYLVDGDKRGIGYKIMIGTKDWLIKETELQDELTDAIEEIHFYPEIQGSGSKVGVWQIVIGVVIVAAAVLSWGGTAAFSWGGLSATIASKTAYSAFALFGMSMVLGGVSQLLVGQPEVGGMGESADTNASYLFQGQVNTTRQGGPIPIGYGELIVGSQVISLSVRSERIPSDTGVSTTSGTSGGGEVSSGGGGGLGTPQYPVGYPYYLPIDWVRVPDPNPLTVEELTDVPPED